MSDLETNVVHCGDALELLRSLPDGCADMVLTDPPYGTTDLEWDKSVDWATFWPELSRVVTQRGAIVMTAQNPFAAELIVSNRKMFRYEWVWEKTVAPNFINVAASPLRSHEQVLVFSHALHINGAHQDRLMLYFPQMGVGDAYGKVHRSEGVAHYHGVMKRIGNTTANEGSRYPRTVLKFANSNQGSLHPTQKPVALFEYLIRTYTRPGDLVIDPFVGSGTTAVAARNLGRRYIVGDQSAEYVAIARQRLAEPFTPQLFSEAAPVADVPVPTQIDMFTEAL